MAFPPLSWKGNEVPPIQKVPKKFEVFPVPSYKILVPTKKYICGWDICGRG